MSWNFIFGFLSPKECPARKNFKYEKIPQIMHFLFLHPCLLENSVHCSSGKFLPSTIRPLSLRLGKGLWHNQQQGKCFNSSVNTATELYCYRTDTWCKAAAASTAPPARLRGPRRPWAKSPQGRGLALWQQSRGRGARRFGVWRQWELDSSQESLTESVTCGKLFNIFKALCT